MKRWQYIVLSVLLGMGLGVGAYHVAALAWADHLAVRDLLEWRAQLYRAAQERERGQAPSPSAAPTKPVKEKKS